MYTFARCFRYYKCLFYLAENLPRDNWKEIARINVHTGENRAARDERSARFPQVKEPHGDNLAAGSFLGGVGTVEISRGCTERFRAIVRNILYKHWLISRVRSRDIRITISRTCVLSLKRAHRMSLFLRLQRRSTHTCG